MDILHRRIKNFLGIESRNIFFSAGPDLTTSFNLTNPVHHEACEHAIESLYTLKNLLAEMRARETDRVLRFLVDHAGTAWFARETRPHVKAPKHFQMTGESQKNTRCRTAGNIKFTNANYRVLKSITHRSGDFHPSFLSLRLFLAILILNEKMLPFALPKILVIKELDPDGCVLKKHRWSISRIKAWVQTFSHDKALIEQLTMQKHPTKWVRYESTTRQSHLLEIG